MELPLSSADRDLYQAIASGKQHRGDASRLLELGLITVDPYASGHYVAQDPRMAARRLMSDAQALVTETVARMAQIPALEELADHFDPFRWYGGPGSEYLTQEEMNVRIGEVLRQEQSELLTAQPGAPVDRDPAVQRVGMERARTALDRGLTVRSMYIHAVYHHPQTRAYLDDLTKAGAEVVTLEFRFPRMVIVGPNLFIDNLVPTGDEKKHTGWHVFDRAAVAWAREVYMLLWEQGTWWRAVRTPSSVLTGRQRAILRELETGDSQQQVGPALGLSERTVTKELAAARAAVGARSMYQLMAWWGRESGGSPEARPHSSISAAATS